MNDFTASNGVEIAKRSEHQGGGLKFGAGMDLGLLTGVTADQEDALREFFQAEADERLGRWRHGDFVVYDRGDYVQVIHEPDGASGMLGTWTRAEASDDRDMGSGFGEAARAYFDAHPEPKPWHDAKPGEIWVLDAHEFSGPSLVEESGVYNQGIGFRAIPSGVRGPGLDAPYIKTARRIYPEVSS